MSELLKNKQVKKALSLLGIEDPENHEVYSDLRFVYANIQEMIVNQSDVVKEGLFIDSVHMHYVYTVDGANRRVNLIISSEHQISQIFIHIIFMTKKVISHMSNIRIDNKTPLWIIRQCADICKEDRGDRWW